MPFGTDARPMMRRLGCAVLMLAFAVEVHAACGAVALLSASAVVHPALHGSEWMLVHEQIVDRWRRGLAWDVCRPVVVTTSAARADSYLKQTEFDNTPFRFNMVQNGRAMTADDFDVWLLANGYGVGRRMEEDASPEQ